MRRRVGTVRDERRFLEYDHIKELVARGPSDAGILSISLDIPAERFHEGDFWRSLLNSGLRGLGQEYPDDKRLQQAIEETFKELQGLEREARFRSLIYFRSAESGWSWWRSLQGSVATRFAWGRRPAVFPLIDYLHREPPVGVFLVSRGDVQCFIWRQSILEEIRHWELDLDTEHWRFYQGRVFPQPMRGQVVATHEERFARRLEEAVRREFAALAPQLEEEAAKHECEAIFVFGARDVRNLFVDSLSHPLQQKVVETGERRFPTVDLKALNEAVAQEVAWWRERTRRLELQALLESLGAGGRGVIGGQEVLDLLAHHRVQRLLVCADLQGPGYRRRDDSLSVVAGLSPLRLRVTENQEQDYVLEPNFLEEIVALAIDRETEIVPMHGMCGQRLKGMGGLGAWLRY